jgi:uncharacterized membrane protein (DUF4010 family)
MALRQIEVGEIVTAGKFLILTGLVLPFLPNEPVTRLTEVTPHQVWLAVLAVCIVSYASYLLQRYVALAGGGLWVAVLGGLYSSTATTVVLARRARAEPTTLQQAQTGIILATSVMYLRLLVIIAIFDRPLAARARPSASCALPRRTRSGRALVLAKQGTNRSTVSCQPADKSIGAYRRPHFRGIVRGDLAGHHLGQD